MGGQEDELETRLHDIRRSLYRVEGGERLKLWIEYTMLQSEGDDPEKHVRLEQTASSPCLLLSSSPPLLLPPTAWVWAWLTPTTTTHRSG